MKSATFFFLMCALILACTYAVPVEEQQLERANGDLVILEAGAEVKLPSLSRKKRATCDLLSFLHLNHTACAIHCVSLLRGFKGGYCNEKAVCICRK